MFSGLLDSIVNQIFLLLIFSLLPAAFIKLLDTRRSKIIKNTVKSFSGEIVAVLNSAVRDYGAINSIIDSYRSKSVYMFIKKKIVKKNLFEINDAINEYINIIRLKYLDDLFADNIDLQNIKKSLFSENKVTQREIYHLLNEIKELETITPAVKENLIKNITEKSINENKIVENNKLIENISVNYAVEFKRILRFAVVLLPLIFLCSYFIYKYKFKPDITFGAVIYIDEKTFTETFSLIEDYIRKETGKSVGFKYYSFDDYEELKNDMKNDVLQGLILNPGTYASLYQNEKNLLDNYQVFLRHLEDEKETYKSVIFTDKSNFLNYCNSIGKPLSYFETELNDSVRYYLKHYIQSGLFGFVHRYSMSGFNLPIRYLWYEFDINYNQHDTALNGLLSDFTGDHDKLINDVSSGRFLCGVTYENRLNIIGIPGIKDKIRILYRSPDIPYNSYLYKNSLDSNLKSAVKNAFLKLNTDEGKKAVEVRKNNMRITGWVSSSDAEYIKMLDSCFNVLNTKLPKPQLVLDNQSSENSHKDRLNDILLVITNKLKKINAWDMESSSQTVKKIQSIIINLKSYADVYDKKQEVTISFNGVINGKDLIPDKINIDGFKGDNDKITKSVFAKILDLIELKTTIKYDYQGLFISLGKEDGITNCKLILPGGEVISPDLYTIEKHKTVFKNSDKQSIDKYRNKQVIVKYDLEEVLKL